MRSCTLLGLVVFSSLQAAPYVGGHITSSAAATPCTGSGNQNVADCRVEYSSLAGMPISEFAYVLQASAGNRAASSPIEMQVLDFSGNLNGSVPANGTANFAWANNTTYSFSMEFNPTNGQLRYTLGNTTINAIIANTTLIQDMFFKTQANSAGTTLTVSNLVVNGTSMGSAVSSASFANTNQQVDYLWIRGLTVGASNTFTMSGNINMSWTGPTPPSNTNTVAYFKFGRVTRPDALVPEPGAMALCGISLLMLGLVKRRKAVAKTE